MVPRKEPSLTVVGISLLFLSAVVAVYGAAAAFGAITMARLLGVGI
jgi:hypothetical protein